MISIEDCAKIGMIGKTHNLYGALIVHTDIDLLQIPYNEPVFILLEGAPVPFYIANDGITQRNATSFIVKFDYVDSKIQADRLVGSELLLDTALIELEREEELIFSELIGFTVADIETDEEGKVLDVADYSGNIVLTIELADKELLLPWSDHYIKDISYDRSIIYAHIPQELKDLN